MFGMFFFVLGINQDIINKDYHKLVQVRHKDLVHEIHENGWCISQSKWYDQILMISVPGHKSCLWNVLLLDLNLVVSGSKIYLGKYFGSPDLIK
jgi:hypothetical protein